MSHFFWQSYGRKEPKFSFNHLLLLTVSTCSPFRYYSNTTNRNTILWSRDEGRQYFVLYSRSRAATMHEQIGFTLFFLRQVTPRNEKSYCTRQDATDRLSDLSPFNFIWVTRCSFLQHKQTEENASTVKVLQNWTCPIRKWKRKGSRID